MKIYRGLILIAVLTICLFCYMYLTPPFTQSILSHSSLLGDIPAYLSRFILSFVFMGIIPLFTSLILGFSFKDMGLVWHKNMFRWKFFWICFLVFSIISIFASFNEDLLQFYPFSRTILEMSADGRIELFILHGFMYLVLYYLPWELFFRGLMILPFVYYYKRIHITNLELNTDHRFRFFYPPNNETQLQIYKNPLLLTLAVLQTLPSTIAHLPHPLIESVGSLIFGYIAAVIVLRTLSIIPVLFIHAVAGILLDTLILIRSSL